MFELDMRFDVAFLLATLWTEWTLEHWFLATFKLPMAVQRSILVVRLSAAITGKCFPIHSEKRAYKNVNKYKTKTIGMVVYLFLRK